jgi:hypothetical protein
MSADPIPAEAFDVAQEAAVATWHVMATTGHRQAVDAAVRAAAPILLAAGRKQAAADALMAARDDLVRTADRLRAKARETGDKTHFGTAAGVSLACFRLVELADRAARPAEGGEPNAG